LQFLYIGNEEELSVAEKIRRYITLGLSLALAVGAFLFLVSNWINGKNDMIYHNLLLVMGGIGGVVLARIGFYRTAFAVILIVGNLSFFVSSVLFNNGSENYLITGIVAVMFMFERRLVRLVLSVFFGVLFNIVKLEQIGARGWEHEVLTPLHYSINIWTFLVGIIAFMELYRVVNQNYRDLLEKQREQLENQTRDLAIANESKEKLFAILSHDLRGPVGNVRSVLDLVMEGDLDAEGFDEFRGDLAREVGDVEVMLENLLGWASSHLHGLDPEPKDFALRRQVEEVLSLLHDRAQRKQIQLVNDVGPGVWVHADFLQIQTVLRNLVSNAIKFTPADSGGEVKVSAEQDGDRVRISVADTGVGMSQDKIALLEAGRIQISDRGTDSEKGFGIGLRICDDFIKANGGQLAVESEVGAGTHFWFCIRPGKTGRPALDEDSERGNSVAE
tara:strand:+ start:12731 stop:14068 length:1338 start_codon:yes stop_codon:yes gene_type:complete